MVYSYSDMKRQCMAMATSPAATQGLSLSPIRASFQNVPKNPVLFLSRTPGQKLRMYAQVQIISIITVSRLWKLKSADIFWKK